MDTFGAWLRQQRTHLKLTREQFAERLGCSVALLRKEGVYFVPLAPVNSTRLIVPVMADGLGFAFQSASPADPKMQLFNSPRLIRCGIWASCVGIWEN